MVGGNKEHMQLLPCIDDAMALYLHGSLQMPAMASYT